MGCGAEFGLGGGGNQGFGPLRRAQGPAGSSGPGRAVWGGVTGELGVSFAALWSTCPSLYETTLSPQSARTLVIEVIAALWGALLPSY